MATKQAVQEVRAEQVHQVQQELKSERVQADIMAVVEEPFQISLKSERVQAPGDFADGPATQLSSVFDLKLNLNQKQSVKIELTALETIIRI